MKIFYVLDSHSKNHCTVYMVVVIVVLRDESGSPCLVTTMDFFKNFA